MLPIVEIASQPRHIQTPLYLHEPSGRRDAENKIAREAVIARLVALPPLARQTESSTSGVTFVIQIDIYRGGLLSPSSATHAIGRESRGERVWPYVEISGVACASKQKTRHQNPKHQARTY